MFPSRLFPDRFFPVRLFAPAGSGAAVASGVFEEGLYERLTSTARVTALTTRGYPGKAPQNAPLPYWVYQKITGPRFLSMEGPLGDAKPRIRVRCYAEDYPGAKNLANAVRKTLEGFRGTMGSTAQVTVGAVFLDSEVDGWDEEAEAFSVALDFSAWHKETTA